MLSRADPSGRFYAEPEPDLDAGNGHQGTAAGLPLWLPVDLEGERKAADAAQGTHPGVQLQQPTPAATVGLVPVELQVRVPACGNLGVAGRQVWLGRRLAGHTVQVRVDAATMHVSHAGRLLKTLPCRLLPEQMARAGRQRRRAGRRGRSAGLGGAAARWADGHAAAGGDQDARARSAPWPRRR